MRARHQAVTLRVLFVGEQQRAGAVVDARRVAGRDRAIRPHHALQLRQCVQRGFARMFVARHDERIALLLRDRDCRDFLRQRAVLLRARRLLLAAQRERILIGAADPVIVRDVLDRLRHRIDAVQLLNQRIDKAPADRRIVDLGLTRERAGGLAHHERRAAHAFHAAGDHQPGFARLDRARGDADRVHAGTAQAVDRRIGHAFRQAREQRRHARDVAVVLAGLVGAAEDHVVDRGPVDVAIALDERLERHCAEVVGANAGQRAAAVAVDRGADCVTEECIGHGCLRNFVRMKCAPARSQRRIKNVLYTNTRSNIELFRDHREAAGGVSSSGQRFSSARLGATRPLALLFTATRHHPSP
ncbi:MAG: hypothetical protein GAK41_01241 [Burkholderia gladioli]|nr:MAG: hypothetical protein GAK41_01241 [Burkholderia gladioli]